MKGRERMNKERAEMISLSASVDWEEVPKETSQGISELVNEFERADVEEQCLSAALNVRIVDAAILMGAALMVVLGDNRYVVYAMFLVIGLMLWTARGYTMADRSRAATNKAAIFALHSLGHDHPVKRNSAR